MESHEVAAVVEEEEEVEESVWEVMRRTEKQKTSVRDVAEGEEGVSTRSETEQRDDTMR